MKNKKFAIYGPILAVVLVIVLVITIIPAKTTDKSKDEPIESIVESTTTVTIADVEDTSNSSSDDGEFLEPNESEADKILSENSKTNETASKKETTTNKTENTTSENEDIESFEEGQKKLENTAEEYLKKHNIDPKTAGETGELCQHCGKKIWNPDKYGNFIPGMPEDYENSGYCLGTCAISFE